MNELENLKVGDLVIVCGSYSDDCLRKVERVTKTQIVVGGTHFRKKDGRLIGGGDWFNGRIRPATEKDIEFFNKVKHEKAMRTFIRDVNWSNSLLESLQKICDLAKKEIGNSAAKQ